VLPVMQWQGSGHVPQRGKMLLTGAQACYNVYATADGRYMTLGALEPQFWRAFCLTVGREDWVPRQADADQDALIAEVAALFATQPRSHWVDLFAGHDACCEPVLALDETFSHPQAVERGLLHEGQLSLPLGRRGVPHARAPELGEHTAELLAELGYTSTDLENLRQQGVL
jgi:alpha-methylacyl-CoA racemase